ncbi:hypothetical protein HDF15_003373 [Granulicella mallensis]|uniref:Uncharacterized protein n=1 Tax=Granulicella mallensis TaxID=940614 RepID=A0A7W7ZRV3_9BACT|nr:hypothetical protein [Granulicella mallensis]
MGSGIRPKCRKGEVTQAGEGAAGAYTATLIVLVIIANKGVDLLTGIPAWMREQAVEKSIQQFNGSEEKVGPHKTVTTLFGGRLR